MKHLFGSFRTALTSMDSYINCSLLWISESITAFGRWHCYLTSTSVSISLICLGTISGRWNSYTSRQQVTCLRKGRNIHDRPKQTKSPIYKIILFLMLIWLLIYEAPFWVFQNSSGISGFMHQLFIAVDFREYYNIW